MHTSIVVADGIRDLDSVVNIHFYLEHDNLCYGEQQPGPELRCWLYDYHEHNFELRNSSSTTKYPVTSSIPVDEDYCLQALESQGQIASTDCSASLFDTTITTGASTVTETLTTTIIESVENTAVEVHPTTRPATTEISLHTITVTSTAFVADVVTSLSTDLTTETVTVGQPTTTTSLQHTSVLVLKRGVHARAGTIPAYAAAACTGWDAYASACGRLGISSSTTTITTTVTETGPALTTSATTTWTTVTSISLDVSSATATTSTTQTDLTTATSTTTTTQTLTATALPPATVVTKRCTLKYAPFALRILSANAGMFRWLELHWEDMSTITRRLVWVDLQAPRLVSSFNLPTLAGPAGVFQSTGGFRVYPVVAVFDLPPPGQQQTQSVRPRMTSRDIAATAVRVGTARHMFACRDADTGAFSLHGEGGRVNILDCEGKMFLSSGDGSDTGLSCTIVVPTIVYF
ncbi:uncharacterized protein B0I36DRAFT_355578 [Microdochium trichocladiopsis]|uniref:Uncharacterized protein n=1 Tax=Microdochium trichocladiopsis TaxID=1682393 RepID=A0A9P8XS12_9PEZI|nr:uncharacterized protein B0I36DRAFT_355578 [Microdochium trichocladiopsis]KAH7014348.1 hypothetical protein B0I36DRAFT_355578 [Microdochium trichocladiopsis]